MHLRSSYIILLTSVLLSCLPIPSGAASSDARADKIKAAFILQFSKYTVWPEMSFPQSNGNIGLCILGHDPFGSTIDQVNKTFHDRKIVISRIRDLTGVQDCHILFVSSDRQQKMVEIVQAVEKQPTLIIGDEKDFLENGGMINFVQVGSKLRFDIHLNNSEQKQLHFSSKLLKVANSVKQDR